jgi:hypothetical protein
VTKKVTISVPDDLHEKMQEWRDDFNFSAIFQEAVHKAIERKEGFKRRLGEVTTMEQVVERLRKEMAESDLSHSEQGKKDGLEWAMAASYDEIQYALSYNYRTGVDPTHDEILGEYFADLLEDEYVPMPLGNFVSWVEGWKEAVEEFWEEIKVKL